MSDIEFENQNVARQIPFSAKQIICSALMEYTLAADMRLSKLPMLKRCHCAKQIHFFCRANNWQLQTILLSKFILSAEQIFYSALLKHNWLYLCHYARH